MNNIDKEFYGLINNLRKLTLDETFYNIKNSFLLLDDKTKVALENFFKTFDYWGTLDYLNDDYNEIYEKAQTLHNHLDDFVWLYERLEDYRSKKVLFAILNNWYCYDFNNLESSRETNFSDYFDLDLVKCQDEVFVDLGAYIGDTIFDYLRIYGARSYKKIYCYEITPNIFALLKNNLAKYDNIEFKRKAVSDKNETLYISDNSSGPSANTLTNEGENEVTSVTLDDDIEDKITTLKMDVEGFEQRAIIGASRHIKEDKPKLLISVYHRNEDLIKIPKMIDDICPNYKFYLRNNGGGIYPTEITLIGIPNQ